MGIARVHKLFFGWLAIASRRCPPASSPGRWESCSYWGSFFSCGYNQIVLFWLVLRLSCRLLNLTYCHCFGWL